MQITRRDLSDETSVIKSPIYMSVTTGTEKSEKLVQSSIQQQIVKNNHIKTKLMFNN